MNHKIDMQDQKEITLKFENGSKIIIYYNKGILNISTKYSEIKIYQVAETDVKKYKISDCEVIRK